MWPLAGILMSKPKVLNEPKSGKIGYFMIYKPYFYWDHKNKSNILYMHYEPNLRYSSLKLEAQDTLSPPQKSAKLSRCWKQGQVTFNKIQPLLLDLASETKIFQLLGGKMN